METHDFGKQISAAARAVARIELRRRKLRRQLVELDAEYRRAQTALRLLVQSVEPYVPPTPAELQAAAELESDQP